MVDNNQGGTGLSQNGVNFMLRIRHRCTGTAANVNKLIMLANSPITDKESNYLDNACIQEKVNIHCKY